MGLVMARAVCLRCSDPRWLPRQNVLAQESPKNVSQCIHFEIQWDDLLSTRYSNRVLDWVSPCLRGIRFIFNDEFKSQFPALWKNLVQSAVGVQAWLSCDVTLLIYRTT